MMRSAWTANVIARSEATWRSRDRKGALRSPGLLRFARNDEADSNSNHRALAPQHHARAAGRLQAGAELLGFRAALRRQADAIERAEAAASHDGAEHER